jgi:hypothetical protein
VDFGDVAPKTTEKRILVLHNDSTRTQRVDLRPTSIDKRDALRVYPTSMELEPGGSREMEISWAPITAGAKMSKKFDFMWNGGSSALKVELRGVCAKSTSVAAKVAPAISTVATKKAGGASVSSAKPLAPVRDTNAIAAAPRVGPASAADLEAVRAPSAAKPWQAAREERGTVAAAADVVFAPARLLTRLPTATPAAMFTPASPAQAQADAEAAAAQDAESVLIDFGTGSPAAPLGASVDPLADALAAAADARSMILGIVSPPPPPADAAAEAEAAFLGANMERFNALRGAPRAEDAEDAFESARESLRSSPRPEEVSRREDESMRDEYESAEEDDGDHARALAQVASAAFAASPPKPPPAAPLGVEADADADAPVEASASSCLLDFSSSFGAGASRAPRPFRPAASVPQPAPSAPVPPPPSDAKAPNVTRRAVALSKPMSKPAIAPATVAEPTAVEPAATVLASKATSALASVFGSPLLAPLAPLAPLGHWLSPMARLAEQLAHAAWAAALGVSAVLCSWDEWASSLPPIAALKRLAELEETLVLPPVRFLADALHAAYLEVLGPGLKRLGWLTVQTLG